MGDDGVPKTALRGEAEEGGARGHKSLAGCLNYRNTPRRSALHHGRVAQRAGRRYRDAPTDEEDRPSRRMGHDQEE